MIKKRLTAILSAVTLFFTGSHAFAEFVPSEEYDVFEQVAGYISTYYIDDSLNDFDIMIRALSKYLDGDDEKLVEILKDMLSSLDPYSEFFTAEEYQGFVNDINRTFYGIGVSIEKREDYVEVTGFTADSPSLKAGIEPGDKISKVNGVDVKGESLNFVRNMIVGELGTTVNVTVLRGSEEFTYTITRAEVNNSTVIYSKLDDEVAYIQIVDMSNHTASEFKETLDKVDADGITNIILDLRGNGGGYLSCAVDIAKMIVPEGKIISTRYRQPFMNKDFYSELKTTKYKFNVLVDEHTASAAEILASALQESGAGKLYGTETYGKGVIQTTFPLSNGSVFKLTVGQYETRDGNSIQDVGITPDFEIENRTTAIDTKKYTSFTQKQKWFEGDTDVNVRAAKERLYLMMYYNGDIDDYFDSELTEAIKLFQQDNNLYPYGVLDINTQTTISNVFGELEVMSDDQLDEAFKAFTGRAYFTEEEN